MEIKRYISTSEVKSSLCTLCLWARQLCGGLAAGVLVVTCRISCWWTDSYIQDELLADQQSHTELAAGGMISTHKISSW